MIILIDSNNVIHKVPHLKNIFKQDKDRARISLVEAVTSRIQKKSNKIIFVFDGHGESKSSTVIFANKLTADEVIRREIENSVDHKKMKVVSSDRDIINFAKVCGCEVQQSDDFWNEINKNPVTKDKNINQNYIYDDLEKPERMSKKEIDEFRKFFT